MTQHPGFLTDDFLHYADECKRMASLARPAERRAPAAVPTLRQWAEQAGEAAARYRRSQVELILAARRPAYS